MKKSGPAANHTCDASVNPDGHASHDEQRLRESHARPEMPEENDRKGKDDPGNAATQPHVEGMNEPSELQRDTQEGHAIRDSAVHVVASTARSPIPSESARLVISAAPSLDGRVATQGSKSTSSACQPPAPTVTALNGTQHGEAPRLSSGSSTDASLSAPASLSRNVQGHDSESALAECSNSRRANEGDARGLGLFSEAAAAQPSALLPPHPVLGSTSPAAVSSSGGLLGFANQNGKRPRPETTGLEPTSPTRRLKQVPPLSSTLGSMVQTESNREPVSTTTGPAAGSAASLQAVASNPKPGALQLAPPPQALPQAAVPPSPHLTPSDELIVPGLPPSGSSGGISGMAGLGFAGPSGSRPPALRRNGSSNSVLAELSRGIGMLSRSNSFLSPAGKAVTRSNSILSLLSGIPTAMRESHSTDRLLGLDLHGDDKVLATLKAMDAGGSAVASALAASHANGLGSSSALLGDRSLSFGQLHHIASLDDMDDPGAVALSLQEDSKWEGS
jgi:hypothetical protein